MEPASSTAISIFTPILLVASAWRSDIRRVDEASLRVDSITGRFEDAKTLPVGCVILDGGSEYHPGIPRADGET